MVRHLPLLILLSMLCGLALSSRDALAQGTEDKPIKITAEELSKECSMNEDASFKKYVNKYMEVTGQVVESKMAPAGKMPWRVDLKGFKNQVVVFNFQKDSPDFAKAKKLTKGQKVVIRGQFLISFTSFVEITKPVLVEPK